MEGQVSVNVAKSAASDPAQLPAYPGPPNSPSNHDSAEYNGNIVTVQPVSAPPMVINTLGNEPVGMVCRSCNERIVTKIKRSAALRTHVVAGILCIIGCWPCVAIPYCTDVCKKAVHYCPKCNAYIGTQL